MVGHQLNSVLIKPVSADCDERCVYCFYRRPSNPYINSSSHRMNAEVLSSFIFQYLTISPEEASFCWQGGEPMLAEIDFFKKVIELQIKHGSPGQVIGNVLQTNGLLIDEEWAKFFKEYNFFLGVSLDGPEELHDPYRGKGTFKKVMEALNILRTYGMEFNILSVVSDLTVQEPDKLFDFFLSQKLCHLQFIPCVEMDYRTGEMTSFSVKPDEYGKFLCRLFDRWYNEGMMDISIRLFDNILMAYLGQEPEICEFKKKCGCYVVLEYNGDIYPCDFFVEKKWCLGNLMETSLEEIITNDKASRFSLLKSVHRECLECPWNFICNYGCPRYRESEEGKSYLCKAYRLFFEYSQGSFESLAKKSKEQCQLGNVDERR